MFIVILLSTLSLLLTATAVALSVRLVMGAAKHSEDIEYLKDHDRILRATDQKVVAILHKSRRQHAELHKRIDNHAAKVDRRFTETVKMVSQELNTQSITLSNNVRLQTQKPSQVENTTLSNDASTLHVTTSDSKYHGNLAALAMSIGSNMYFEKPACIDMGASSGKNDGRICYSSQTDPLSALNIIGKWASSNQMNNEIASMTVDLSPKNEVRVTKVQDALVAPMTLNAVNYSSVGSFTRGGYTTTIPLENRTRLLEPDWMTSFPDVKNGLSNTIRGDTVVHGHVTSILGTVTGSNVTANHKICIGSTCIDANDLYKLKGLLSTSTSNA